MLDLKCLFSQFRLQPSTPSQSIHSPTHQLEEHVKEQTDQLSEQKHILTRILNDHEMCLNNK